MSLEMDRPATARVASKEPRASGARLGYVDGLRALAALAVMISHIQETLWASGLPHGLTAAFTNPIFYGHLSVSVFIVLSGFSLMLPVARNANRLPWSAAGFYWRRARRILPPYYLALGLSLALIWLVIGRRTGTPWDIALSFSGPQIIEHLLLFQDLSHANPSAINTSFWSIALECQIYLLFPALVLLWRRYSPLFVASIVTIGSCVLAFALTPTWIGQIPGYLVSSFAPQYVGLFAMGMFAASLTINPSPRWERLRAWRLWEIVTITCVAMVVFGAGAVGIAFLDPVIGVMTVGLLLVSARPGAGRRNPLRASLEWRPLVWIGGFSYSLYLIHAPLVQALWQYVFHPLRLGDMATYLLLLLVGCPLIVLAAWGFWWLCERPFLNSRVAAAWPGWRGSKQTRGDHAGSTSTR